MSQAAIKYGMKVLRDHIGRVDDLLADAQLLRQLEVDEILFHCAGLRPDLADISPVRHLGINHRQRPHHLPRAFGCPIAAGGQDHQLVFRYSQNLANRLDLHVIAAVRRVEIRAATHRKHHDVVSLDAIPDIHLFHPGGGNQNQRQSIQQIAMLRNISVGHEPGNGLHAKLLRVHNQIRKVAPEAHANHHVRLEPAVVPFLFQGRFQMDRVDVHTHLAQAFAQQFALQRKAGGRCRIFGQHKYFHDCCSLGDVRVAAACAESKHQKPSSRGVVCASQLSAPYPYTSVINLRFSRQISSVNMSRRSASSRTLGRYARFASS
jgi:hypothetical protein